MGGTAFSMSRVLPAAVWGVATWHTAVISAWFFRNLQVIHPWIAGEEDVADKISTEMANALVNFAYTGNPSQEGLEWAAFSIENGETMVFDRTSEVRNYHDKELMELMAK
jgi:para-nitrobenzyl esterase